MSRQWSTALVACTLVTTACGSPARPLPSAPAPGAGNPSHPAASSTGVATGDGGIGAGALPLDRDYPRVVARSIELYEQLLVGLTRAGVDCTAGAAAVTGVATTYADVIAANATIVREARVGALKVALAPHEARFSAAAKAVIGATTLSACAKDPAFTAAFTQLVGAPP